MIGVSILFGLIGIMLLALAVGLIYAAIISWQIGDKHDSLFCILGFILEAILITSVILIVNHI